MSVRIIHGADFHLDSPFDGLGGDKAALRRSEQRRLLERLGEETVRRRADLMLLAGDLLDGMSVYPETGEMLLSMLRQVKIPVFIAPGNHDWYSRRSVYARLRLPENVHIFTAPRLEGVPLPTLGVTVWGAGYTSNSCPPLLCGFHVEKTAPRDLALLVLHAEVGRKDSPYCPVTEDELRASGFAYAALGHIHIGSGLRRAGACRYAWPGCMAGRGFDECGPKGVLQVDVSPEECRAEFVPMGGREYRKLTLEAGEDALSAILEAIPGDAARHIYKIILTGESVAPPDLRYLRETLRDKFFHLSLVDETVPARDIWEQTSEDTLTGAFLRRMRARLNAAADEQERALILDAVRLGLSSLEGREVQL